MLQPNEQFHHNYCYATGWGKDQFGAEGQFQVAFRLKTRLQALAFAGGVEGDRSASGGAG